MSVGLRAPIAFRPKRSTDVPCIVSDWTDAHWNVRTGGDPFAGVVGHRAYVRLFRALQLRAIEAGEVLVAEFPDAPVGVEIVGWACGEGDVLHFVAVKRPYRCQGIGLQLVRRLGGGEGGPGTTRFARHSHVTRQGLALTRAFGLHYDPYAFSEPA